MSGPKVVNLEAVRRRQQRECLALLHQFPELLEEWRRALEDSGTFTDELSKEISAWSERMEAKRRDAQWAPLLDELKSRREFFRAAITAAGEDRIRKRAHLRERRRRLELAVAMVVREARAANRPAPDLEEILETDEPADPAAAEAVLARMEAALQSALWNSAEDEEHRRASSRSAAQNELADALREENQGSDSTTITAWLASRPGGTGGAARQAVQDRLARALAEIEWRAPAEVAAPLLARARRISREESARQRDLLTDSLLLEADELCRAQRDREKLEHELKEEISAMVVFQSSEAAAWRERLTAALDNPTASAVRDLMAAAQAWRMSEAAREDAVLRRETLLRSLAALGYEVREGMSTAWAEDGRVVVRKPDDPNYGVELASPTTGAGASVQARVVAFAGGHRSAESAQRDHEIESTWCHDFQRLRDLLTAEGFNPSLIHAMPVGAVPIKVVSAPERTRDPRSLPATSERARRERNP